MTRGKMQQRKKILVRYAIHDGIYLQFKEIIGVATITTRGGINMVPL
jgi:hypothetical protein